MGRLVVILAVALVVFSPQEFLRIVRSLGSTLIELQRAVGEFTEAARDLKPLEPDDPAPPPHP